MPLPNSPPSEPLIINEPTDSFSAHLSFALRSPPCQVINLRAELQKARTAHAPPAETVPSGDTTTTAAAATRPAPSPGTLADITAAAVLTGDDAGASVAAADSPDSFLKEWEELMRRTSTLQGSMQRFALQLAAAPPTADDFTHTRLLGRRLLSVSPVPGERLQFGA